MSLRVHYEILNQKGTPAFYSDIFANRPTFGFAGRVFISTDTGEIFEDTGTAWTLIADAGAGTTGTLQQVTTNGKTTNQGIIITAGNLGIGTATAGAPLDVHGTGTIAQFNGTGTNNAYVFFQNAGTSKWRLGNNYNAAANSFDLYNNTLASVALSVNNAYNVLQLNANLAIKQSTGIFTIAGYNAIACDSGGFFFNCSTANSAYFNLINLTGSRSYTFPDTNGTLALTSQIPAASQWTTSGSNIYYNTGSVLIGTTTSNGFRFKVSNNGAEEVAINPGDSANVNSYINFNRSTSSYIAANYTASEHTFLASGTKFIVKSTNNGTIVMGTADSAANSINFYGNYSNNQPGYAIYGSSANLLLEFNGNTKALYLGNLGTGTLYSNSGIISNTSPSDIRLKDNVQVLKYGLKDILKLRPVTYNWKKDEINQGIQFGFIAQEVQEVIPEAVKEFGTDIKYLGLEKDAIYAALVNAIKELNDKIDNLKN